MILIKNSQFSIGDLVEYDIKHVILSFTSLYITFYQLMVKFHY